MTHLGYSRFRETLRDLRDCTHHLGRDANLSEPEAEARRQLILLCAAIAMAHLEQVGEPASCAAED